jgi:hypothetical protein
VASNSQSSSLLAFGTHLKSYPNIFNAGKIVVQTKRIDMLITGSEIPNFINLDIQGVELEAIQSLGKLIDKVDYIYTEVNWKEVYINCTKIRDFDSYLDALGFKRISQRRYLREGWGDALYIRKTCIKKPSKGSVIRRIKKNAKFYLEYGSNSFKTFILTMLRIDKH